MYFLFIKIINIDYKDDIFMALESVGISKASYLEAYNLDMVLSDEIPLFKGFFISEEEKLKNVIIINSLVEEKKQIKEFLKILEESSLDIRNEEIIRVLAWPLEVAFGPGITDFLDEDSE